MGIYYEERLVLLKLKLNYATKEGKQKRNEGIRYFAISSHFHKREQQISICVAETADHRPFLFFFSSISIFFLFIRADFFRKTVLQCTSFRTRFLLSRFFIFYSSFSLRGVGTSPALTLFFCECRNRNLNNNNDNRQIHNNTSHLFDVRPFNPFVRCLISDLCCLAVLPCGFNRSSHSL